MSKRKWVTLGLIGLVVAAIIIGYAGCSRSSSGSSAAATKHDSSESNPAPTKLIIVGESS